MKKSFPGYQPRTPGKLWDSCVFAFDASALLDPYRMTRNGRDEFLSILERLKGRVWLPHQAGWEFYDNRLEVIRTGMELHEQIPKRARDAAAFFKKELDRCRRYQWIEPDRWLEILTKA